MVKWLMIAFRWLLSGAQAKFVVFSVVVGIYSLVTFILLPEISCCGLSPVALTSAFNNLSPSTWYFINLFNFTAGLPIVICAFVARFIIRRLPFVG